jgi:hypothetical protein
VSWRSVLPRGLAALTGTLTLSVAFAFATGHPEYALPTWMFTFGFAWLTWVLPPPPRTSRPRWWSVKIAGQLLAWFVVWLFVVSLVVLLITPS